jgi:hypothetical protein
MRIAPRWSDGNCSDHVSAGFGRRARPRELNKLSLNLE